MAASTTTLVSSPNPSTFGQSVTYTATVDSVPPGTFTPTGTITFALTGGPTITVSVDAAGQASVTDNSLNAGSHNVTATYSGDANLDPSSATIVQQVGQAATTTSVTTSPPSTVFGEPVTLTASVAAVAPGAGVPTGR
jgi:hypothetical protein